MSGRGGDAAKPVPRHHKPLDKRFHARLSEAAYAKLRELAARSGLGNNYVLTVLLEDMERTIDLAAFELIDGRIIRVSQDWHGIGRRSRFLRNVAREACDLFHVVLTPSHNNAHQDHLHFDTGPWRLCVT